MKAVVVNEASTGVEVVDHEMPSIGHGEALVKVEYCGVCHTDLHARCAWRFWTSSWAYSRP